MASLTSWLEFWRFVSFVICITLFEGECRFHHLSLKDDVRSKFLLNEFGFYANGYMQVNVSSISLNGVNMNDTPGPVLGFSVKKSDTYGFFRYLEKNEDYCALNKEPKPDEQVGLLILDFKSNKVKVTPSKIPKFSEISFGTRSSGQKISTNLPEAETKKPEKKSKADEDVEEKDEESMKTKRSSDKAEVQKPPSSSTFFPMHNNIGTYSFQFYINVNTFEEEGVYSISFHNCYGRDLKKSQKVSFNLDIHIEEKNPESYLSAGEIPLPKLYISMSLFFLIAGAVWVHVLRKRRLKGALLFITIALIGTGWAFVKHILSDKDKKIFMIVIPLQVLANVAYIIIESTEEGTTEYVLWMEVLFLVDLLCCGAILFPVVW
ncbi:protein GPR107-like [Protopterus annectens]|uniref:protein GPR107-like n=1 Tax=Protopterus annectens TaxID=7888 RepID=UPI001CFA0221|nr:protein GPR107-like [Protopterus annectens]